MPDFEQLIHDCFANPADPAALERFYKAFRKRILAVLLSMYSGGPELAEDAYQEAFIKYIRMFREGRKPGIDYPGYVVAIAKNCLIDELRRRQPHVPIDELFREPPSAFPGGSDIDEPERSLDERLDLLQAMSRLDRRCQFSLESYYFRGTSAPDLAHQLGVEPGSIYMALKRCRSALKKLLGGG